MQQGIWIFPVDRGVSRDQFLFSENKQDKANKTVQEKATQESKQQAPQQSKL